MPTRLFTSALIAGAAAGLIAALLQLFFVQPVLLHAELYEGGELTHYASASEHDHGEAAEEAASEDGHDHAAPSAEGDGHARGVTFDAPRDLLSVVFSIAVYVGYGLILTAAMALSETRGHVLAARQGIIWGVAGWVAVQLAPAFGLPPELPGMAAADVGARAIWWVATVVVSAVALWLLAFGRNWTAWGAAIVLLALPHLIGAPHPGAFSGPTPPELAAEFAGRALGVGLAAWVLLGLFTATLLTRSRAE